MGENVTNVFGLNLCQLRKDASPNRFYFGPFSFRSSHTQQDNQPTRIYSNICVDDISCPKGEIFLLIFDSWVVGEGLMARPELSMVLLEPIQDY